MNLVSTTGERCSRPRTPQTTGLVTRFKCSISFNALESRQLVATYSGSTRHSDSVAARVNMATKRVADITVGIDDDALLTAPGAPASYLMALRTCQSR